MELCRDGQVGPPLLRLRERGEVQELLLRVDPVSPPLATNGRRPAVPLDGSDCTQALRAFSDFTLLRVKVHALRRLRRVRAPRKSFVSVREVSYGWEIFVEVTCYVIVLLAEAVIGVTLKVFVPRDAVHCSAVVVSPKNGAVHFEFLRQPVPGRASVAFVTAGLHLEPFDEVKWNREVRSVTRVVGDLEVHLVGERRSLAGPRRFHPPYRKLDTVRLTFDDYAILGGPLLASHVEDILAEQRDLHRNLRRRSGHVHSSAAFSNVYAANVHALGASHDSIIIRKRQFFACRPKKVLSFAQV